MFIYAWFKMKTKNTIIQNRFLGNKPQCFIFKFRYKEMKFSTSIFGLHY